MKLGYIGQRIKGAPMAGPLRAAGAEPTKVRQPMPAGAAHGMAEPEQAVGLSSSRP